MDLKELTDMPDFASRVNPGSLDAKDLFLHQQLDILQQKLDWIASHTILAYNQAVQTETQFKEIKKERWFVIGGGAVLLVLIKYTNFLR